MGVFKSSLFRGFAIALAIPLSFMVVQVLLYEGMVAYHLQLSPLYDGRPHYMFEYALRSLSLYNNLRNFLSVFVVWFFSAYFIVTSRGKRGVVEAILSPIFARVFLVLYVVLRGEVKFVIDLQKLLVPLIGILGGLTSVGVKTLRKPKPLFQKLKEVGFKFEPHRLAHVEVPHRCPYCGAELHSNADVCRNCGRSLKEHYSQKVPEELRKYAF